MRETYQPKRHHAHGVASRGDNPMRETHQPPTTSPAGPPHDHTHPCHSRTHPRHSREGGNPPRCDHTPEETAPFPPATKSDRIRQKSTETRVRAFPNSRAYARARGDAVPFPFSRHGDCPQSGSRLDSSPSFPHPRHSRVGGNPSRCAIRRTAWSCRPRTVIPTDQTEPPAALC